MDERTLIMEMSNPEVNADQKEKIFMSFVSSFSESRDFQNILSLIINIKSVWADITTARMSKMVKNALHILPPDSSQEILCLVTELIGWADKENKKILKLDLECKKINALLRIGRYTECLESITRVLRDLKRIDDKENQIRLYIYESRAFYELGDMARARSSMTSARVLAVSSYCSSELQAQIDLLSGMFICDERQYSTAYSYFLEAIDSFNLSKEAEGALLSARYLLLSKVIDKKWGEISSIIRSKVFFPFLNDEFIVLLLKIKESCKDRDLRSYQCLLEKNKSTIDMDSFMRSHLYFLYDVLFESNILKIIEPYSNIKVGDISQKIGFSTNEVEEKLRKMILDGVIQGTIDHKNGSLVLAGSKDPEDDNRDHAEQIRMLKSFLASF